MHIRFLNMNVRTPIDLDSRPLESGRFDAGHPEVSASRELDTDPLAIARLSPGADEFDIPDREPLRAVDGDRRAVPAVDDRPPFPEGADHDRIAGRADDVVPEFE